MLVPEKKDGRASHRSINRVNGADGAMHGDGEQRPGPHLRISAFFLLDVNVVIPDVY